jgi:ribonuclease P protein component
LLYYTHGKNDVKAKKSKTQKKARLFVTDEDARGQKSFEETTGSRKKRINRLKPKYMLEKKYRLPATLRLANGSSYTTPLFFLKTSSNGLTYSRFGFVIRKTVDKRATVRNRIRRVFRSCIEEMREELKEGVDMLFLLKSPVLEMEREALYNTLYSFLKEKGLVK